MEINKLRQKYWEERNFSINDYRLTPQELILHDWFKYTEWLEAKILEQSRQPVSGELIDPCSKYGHKWAENSHDFMKRCLTCGLWDG